MKKASFVGIIHRPRADIDARVFMMDPPHCGFEFVKVSATDFQSICAGLPNFAAQGRTLEAETYIFGCDASGEILNYKELDGSYRGGTSHAQALLNAGYEIVSYKGEHNDV